MCVCVCARVRVCVCVRACARACVRACVCGGGGEIEKRILQMCASVEKGVYGYGCGCEGIR